jgi:hypothetical protein
VTSRALARPAALLAAVAGLCGCGGGRTPVYPAEGQLLIGGRPAANVFVLFSPAGGAGAVRPSATTDADGRFRLTTHEAYDGGPAGEYVVTLLYEPVNSPLGRPKGPPPAVPAAYQKAETSPLRATIEPRPGNQLEPFRVP